MNPVERGILERRVKAAMADVESMRAEEQAGIEDYQFYAARHLGTMSAHVFLLADAINMLLEESK